MHSIKFKWKSGQGALLIASAFLLASLQSAFAANADFHFQRSLKRVKAGDKKGAADSTAALSKRVTNVAAATPTTVKISALPKPSKAIELKVLKKDMPLNAWLVRGDQFFREKRYGRAIESYKRALYEDQSLSSIINRKIQSCVAKLK